MITYKDSVSLAHRIRKTSPAVLGVELFGSVVRKGYGWDADFLILVDNELAKSWWKEQRELIRVRWPEALHGTIWIVKKFIPFVYSTTVRQRRRKRLEATADMLGLNLKALADTNGKIPDFEMFLVPIDWRIGKEVNMNIMKQTTDLTNDENTLGFMKRVAREVIKLNL